ncbi:AI-2E family transporter [Flavobacterium rhizosphaerae]|uniref:AI-2E family transporter n=1 Tax=Flavobacterium rhizosphaerae TaxID=3163298 RepID=A0ABW8YXC3_9FLAO
MVKGKQIVFRGAAVILGMYFLVLGIVKAKPLLAPLATAILLAMLMIPVARKMESWKINRVVTSLLNVFFLFLISLGFAALIGMQIQNFVADWDKAEEKIMPKIEQLKDYIFEKTPLKKEQLSLKPGDTKVGEHAIDFANGIYNFTGNYLITLIYTFFLLNYRQKFKNFFIRLFKDEDKDEVEKTLQQTSGVTQKYLVGKFLLMIFLAVLYAIGMGVTGVNNFIVISLLAALLSIIPYIGNIIAFFIAIGLGYLSGGDTTALIGIIVTFGVAQFIESYLLEPYVVGDNVNLDPLITILAVIVGSLLWGIIGMIIAVPILGMVNVVFKHVQALKPYHYLLSNNADENKDG